jgi:hypothetical protein
MSTAWHAPGYWYIYSTELEGSSQDVPSCASATTMIPDFCIAIEAQHSRTESEQDQETNSKSSKSTSRSS